MIRSHKPVLHWRYWVFNLSVLPTATMLLHLTYSYRRLVGNFQNFCHYHTVEELSQFEADMDEDYEPDPRIVASVVRGNHDPVILRRWPKASDFDDIYRGDPFTQAHLAMALIGMRAHMDWMHEGQAVEAINAVLGLFTERYPDLTEDKTAFKIQSVYFSDKDYYVTDRLTHYLGPMAVRQAWA